MGDDFSRGGRGGRFPPTRRSAVAGVASDDPAARARAFEILVRAYWKPVYTHVRLRWKRTEVESADLTQEFFARAFEKEYFATYDPDRARFRTYLKTCLDRFVMESARGDRREKRGGGAVKLSLDFDLAEREMEALRASHAADVEAVFDREWVRSLFSAAVEALRETCVSQEKQVYFSVFERYVLEPEAGAARPPYAALASELGISVTDVTNHLAWTRREFRRLVLDELREITATEEEFKSEARAVLGVDP
jgi:RNA polymerase sigma factor (sigma-70 family)